MYCVHYFCVCSPPKQKKARLRSHYKLRLFISNNCFLPQTPRATAKMAVNPLTLSFFFLSCRSSFPFRHFNKSPSSDERLSVVRLWTGSFCASMIRLLSGNKEIKKYIRLIDSSSMEALTPTAVLWNAYAIYLLPAISTSRPVCKALAKWHVHWS